jgi:tetratricopeptide (TPR) repeat protein
LRQAVSANDFERAAASYREWKADPVNAYALADAEVPINSLGYELLGARRLDQAIEVFKLNTAAFPRSANAFDSLGEAYKTRGDREQAIRSYEKALELDPNMRSAIEALRELRSH